MKISIRRIQEARDSLSVYVRSSNPDRWVYDFVRYMDSQIKAERNRRRQARMFYRMGWGVALIGCCYLIAMAMLLRGLL